MPVDRSTETPANTADQEKLIAIAPVIVAACPGLQEEAHAVASEILIRHGITDLDPDQVWWHRFNNISASSTKAFLLWEHYAKPSESMTLTQLVIHRYHVTDQDNADLLDSDGGFYTADASASVYNETNEVRMYPSEVLKDLWQKNLSERYLNRLNTFWDSHFDEFRTLAKSNYLSKAVEARQNSQLEEEDFQTVIKAVAGDMAWPVTLATLRAQTAAPAGFRICALDVAGYVATDILRIVDSKGRQITYVPGADEPFHVHPTLTDMHWWVLMQMNDDTLRAGFMTHFSLADRQAINDNITPLMNRLVGTWGTSDHHLINQKDIAIQGDVFTWQSRAVQNAMLVDADLTLVTNGQMRKQLWLGYLTVGLHVFGPLALLGWPIALPVIGASIAAMGLNIDKAVNGKTAAERKAGVTGAVVNGINLLFNIPLLKEIDVLEDVGASVDAAEAAEMARLQESAIPAEPIGAEDPQVPDDSEQALAQLHEFSPLPRESTPNVEVPEHWQSNEILESETPIATTGKFQNIYSINGNPSTAIMMNDVAYYVRYEADINGGGTWAIIDPANPHASSGSIPVRLNARGEWEPVPKNRLRGGGNDAVERVPGTSQSAALSGPSTKYDAPNGPSLTHLALGKAETHIKIVYLPDGSLKGVSAYQEFVAARRTTLATDARLFHSRPRFFTSLPARPVQPVITPSTTLPELIQNIFENTHGLVIGESQDRIASMRFLIENMQTLARQGVKTIYLHRLLNDFNQIELNAFAKTGKMDGLLEKYLKLLQSDPSGQFTPLELVNVARESGIRIQATDCLASYRFEGAPLSVTSEQSIKSYLTHTIIQANEALNGPGKWVALTGQENTNTFRGIAGISEMEGAIGLRIEEVLPDQPLHLELDHGIEVGRDIPPTQTQMRGDLDTLYADLSLQMPTPVLQRSADELKRILFRQGMFTIEESNQVYTLIHRSRDGQLVRTSIERTPDGGFLINRPAWTEIHQVPCLNITHLARALTRMGLRLEGRLPL